jgi:dienelactone hydrolase
MMVAEVRLILSCRRVLAWSFILVIATIPAPAAQPPPPSLPTAQVIDTVACLSDPAQSYALYLPSSYTPAKRWPIIYAFDPFARGKIPVKLYRDAAEKYGYIVAGSNNSRNFAFEESSKGANAMWADTHQRLSLDERQVYTTGFSGGARIAGLVALNCTPCKIAGVIAHGAGYPITGTPRPRDSLLHFLAVGDEDFNWPEVVGIRREREETSQAYRVRVFNGPHQWAPAAVIEDAVEWIHLKAMQAGAAAKDTAFIDRVFGRVQAEAHEAEQRKDAIEQLSAYRSLVSDFGGLKEVAAYQQELQALQKSDELKTALKKERDAIAEQQSLTAEISGKLAGLADAASDQRMAIRQAVVDGMGQLKGQAEHFKDPTERLIRLRAFNDLWAQGIEAGQAQLVEKHFANAEAYFHLMADVSPQEPWPVLLLADTHCAMGNKRQAIKDVREAVRRGVKNPDVFEKDEALKPLHSEPGYRKILEEMQ